MDKIMKLLRDFMYHTHGVYFNLYNISYSWSQDFPKEADIKHNFNLWKTRYLIGVQQAYHYHNRDN